MKRLTKRLVVVVCLTSSLTMIAFALLFSRIQQPRQISKLESTIATMPLGISGEEAVRIIGSEPDNVSEERGVLMSSVTMLAESNSLAARYGNSESYSIRVWKRNGITAAVAVNADGNVAGRWTCRDTVGQ